MQTWEGTYARPWDVLQEDEDGGIQSTVEKLLARGRRKRAIAAETPLRRSIIRHLFVILDLSESMQDKDFRPSRCGVNDWQISVRNVDVAVRWEVTLQYLRGYVAEWFDQNPLGQMGVILMRDRLSETLITMGGEREKMYARNRQSTEIPSRESTRDPRSIE